MENLRFGDALLEYCQRLMHLALSSRSTTYAPFRWHKQCYFICKVTSNGEMGKSSGVAVSFELDGAAHSGNRLHGLVPTKLCVQRIIGSSCGCQSRPQLRPYPTASRSESAKLQGCRLAVGGGKLNWASCLRKRSGI